MPLLLCLDLTLSFLQLCLKPFCGVLETQTESKLLGPAMRSSFFLFLSQNHIRSATSFCFSTQLCFHCNPSFLLLISGAYQALCFHCLQQSLPPQSQEFCFTCLLLPFMLLPGALCLCPVANCLFFQTTLLVRLTCPFSCCSFTSCQSCSSCWQASLSSP